MKENMIRDSFFSPSRFLMVCKRDLMENWKSNLLRFVVLYASLAITIIFVDWSNNFSTNSTVLGVPSMIVYAVLGCTYASTIMDCMATKEKRITYLMLAATSFEKYLSRLAYSLIVYSVAFLVAFELADYTRILFMTSFSLKSQINPIPISSLWNTRHEEWSIFYNISAYLFFHSLFVLGGNIWYKKTFPKTIAALGVIVLIYGKVLEWFLQLFITDGSTHVNSTLTSATFDNHKFYIGIVLIVIALFNWTLSYFRFKEAEVINRII